ncbi:hypothetical protein ACLD9W_09055 [Neisseria sp. WLZKY-1]|uniref:hypothetical protein n=1 Tax=Neisseria sp. WLZKY-1 TaxID=3390377 RepID=UPI00397B9E97
MPPVRLAKPLSDGLLRFFYIFKNAPDPPIIRRPSESPFPRAHGLSDGLPFPVPAHTEGQLP